MKQNAKNCAAVIKCTGGASKKQTFYRESKFDTDVSSNTQSDSSTKHFKSAFSQATLHSFMNKKTREEIVAKLVAVDGFPPSVFCKSEFICQAFGDTGMLFQKNLNHAMQSVHKQYEIT